MRQIILDTETTGLEPEKGHRIIELGCLEMVNRKITGSTLHLYFNPGRDIDEGAFRVHGISSEFLANKPVFRDCAEQILRYIYDAELIIHNASFDIGFLDHELKLTRMNLGKITDYCRVVDTLKLAREKHPGQKNSLDALCKRYNVDNKHRDLHGALLDSELLARVYLAMTGGQTSLFTEEVGAEVSSGNGDSELKFEQVNKRKLAVIKASPEELAAHESYFTTKK